MAMQDKESRKLRDTLDQAHADFDGRFPVAFLGTRYAGKTIHCALLKDAAARHLMRHTNGKYLGVATVGAGRINRIVDALYDGRFPEKTTEGEAVQLTVEISSTENGTDIDLIFHDMAGEEYDDLLVKEMPVEGMSVEERIRKILTTSKMEDKAYGLMAHLIFAKIYVILVDCTCIESWASTQAYIKDAIRSIHGIKKYVRALHHGKISSHLAIVFSKCDTLASEKSAGELAEKLDEVNAAVTKYVGGEVRHFRSRLDSTKMSRRELEKIGRDEHRAQLDDAESRMKARKDELRRAKANADKTQTALLAATANLDTAKSAGDAQSIDSQQAEYARAQKVHDEALQLCAELDDAASNARAKIDAIHASGPPTHGNSVCYKPSKPLSYNTDEYLDLIDWMIRMARREAGY